jgi:hypothetical protein
MIAKAEPKPKSLLEAVKDTPYEWAFQYLAYRYGEDNIAVNIDEMYLSVGIKYGSQLTVKGVMVLGVLLQAASMFQSMVNGLPVLLLPYSFNEIAGHKEEMLAKMCDGMDDFARSKKYSIPVVNNGHLHEY